MKKLTESEAKTESKPKSKPKSQPRATPTSDGHHVVIDGRKWRATNPDLAPDVRQNLVNELMSARRAVGAALKNHDEAAEKAARHRVSEAKIALGERGPRWWDESEKSGEAANESKIFEQTEVVEVKEA